MTTGMLKVVAPPVVVVTPSEVNSTEGSYTQIDCAVQGIPEPEV